MEPNKNQDFKNKVTPQYTSDSALSRPGPSNNQWHEQSRDRKPPIKRDLSPSSDRSKEKAIKKKDPHREDGNNDRPNVEQMPTLVSQQSQQQGIHQQAVFTGPYSQYGYSGPENYPNYDPNQGNYAVMPQYNLQIPSWSMPANNNAPMNPSASYMNVPNGMDMINQNTSMGTYSYMGVPNDPSMYGMAMGNCYPYSVMGNTEMVPSYNLDPVTLSTAVMTPPPPGERRSRRARPLGCKTVFVGSLPEKITEDIIREAFSKCGDIDTIRMSKRNFCHVRFTDMESVDRALLFSGYRLKIENKDEAAYNGKLHVDYANARDDQHEYEVQERTRKREERHKAQADQSLNPPSPPTPPHYSESEASSLGENLRKEDTFHKALNTLTSWLVRGECNRRNFGNFYSMIQSTNSHVKKLLLEKDKYEEEARKAKENLKIKTAAIQIEFTNIEKVFEAAEMQRNWDHFSKSQRKNIEKWKTEIQKLKVSLSNFMVNEREEEEMDVSDSEDNNEDPVEIMPPENVREKVGEMQERMDTLNHQLASAQQEMQDIKAKCDEQAREISEMKTIIDENKKNGVPAKVENNSGATQHLENVKPVISCDIGTQSNANKVDATENETRLITLIATFLHVHPFGASIDYICSYLVKIDRNVSTRDIENLLQNFPKIFKEEVTGIGATLEKKWTYIGFKT